MCRVSIVPVEMQLRSVLEDGITFIEDQLQSLGLAYLIGGALPRVSPSRSHPRLRALEAAGNLNRDAANVLEVCGFTDLLRLDRNINDNPSRRRANKIASRERWAS